MNDEVRAVSFVPRSSFIVHRSPILSIPVNYSLISDRSTIEAKRSLIRSLKRVVEWLRGSDLRAFVRDRDGEQADAFVVGQQERPRARGHVERVGEEVRVGVSLLRAVRVVSVRGEPGERRALDEAGLQPREL